MEDKLEVSDLGTFLGWISHKLCKEGHSLQALAEMWFDKDEDKFFVIRQQGIDICHLGEKLLTLRNQLCRNCMLKEVVVTIHIGTSDSPKEGKETDQN
jgi:hypothetical protein